MVSCMCRDHLAAGPCQFEAKAESRAVAGSLSSVAYALFFPSSIVTLQQHDMSTHLPATKYRLYPAYCFRASPTFNTWVKLTAANIHALRAEPEFPS